MSEILQDAQFTNVNLTSNLGLNMSGNAPRIKHNGAGTFNLISTLGQLLFKTVWSSGTESIKFQSSYGGILLNSTKKISLQTSDTSNGIQIGTSGNVPVTIGGASNDLTIKSNLTVSVDFTVHGNTVQHNVSTYNVDDPVIVLGDGQTSPGYDLGFIGSRGTSSNIALFWDESADQFVGALTDSVFLNIFDIIPFSF